MKITAKKKRIDGDFKYKIGDYVYYNGDSCCVIGYHIGSGYGLYYCIQIPAGGHTGDGSVNEYGERIDLSRFKCWFVKEGILKK